jgi:hypothetical protein
VGVVDTDAAAAGDWSVGVAGAPVSGGGWQMKKHAIVVGGGSGTAYADSPVTVRSPRWN